MRAVTLEWVGVRYPPSGKSGAVVLFREKDTLVRHAFKQIGLSSFLLITNTTTNGDRGPDSEEYHYFSSLPVNYIIDLRSAAISQMKPVEDLLAWLQDMALTLPSVAAIPTPTEKT